MLYKLKLLSNLTQQSLKMRILRLNELNLFYIKIDAKICIRYHKFDIKKVKKKYTMFKSNSLYK